ncbi:phage/plasmid primase, P4 family [Clostridium sp.]|uniref:phage/plasmid primase, P4 family n=1 Tax=Clostridium sp. TaxID=1506 RepID=UPI002FDE8F6C
MDYHNIKAHFTVKNERGDVYKAICPAHPDKEASLSIKYDRAQGKTILKCHAGCETEEIVKAAGLEMSDLFDKPMDKDSGKMSIEAVYKYTDEAGKVLFEKVRFKGKKFSQRRIIDGATVWGLDAGIYYETFSGSNAWSMKERKNVRSKEFEGIEPVIYNLPGIIEAIKDNKPVFIVEGEKDSDNLIKAGLAATTSFDGASKSKQNQKWRDNYNKYFEGARVVLLPDNDNPGRAHMKFIANKLSAITEDIKIINLPGLEIKEDVSDWLDFGGTKDELLELVESAEKWNPALEPEKVNLINFNFSDVGNAERLVAMYNKIIRYNPIRKKWLIWSGKHWQVDCIGRIEVLAKSVIKSLQQQGKELPKSIETEDIKKQVSKFVLRSENDNRIRAMINQSRTEHNIVLNEMNKDVYLLNLRNGTLNLKTGELQEHNRRDYITRLVNVDFKPGAKCPNWVEFADKIFMGNKELIEYIQKSIGYSMTGDSNLQCFYILHGQGSNGKGTFMKAIMTILGDYAATLKGNSLMEKIGDEGARGDLAKLEGKYFVCVNELEERKCFDEALVKSLTSGADEVVPVRRMYEEEFDLHPTFKLWMTTNKLPRIKGTDNGIWRRIRKIPFEYNFENDENKDEHFFEDKLMPEMSGILNWALEGCLKWQKEGMEVPEDVKLAIDDYKNEMDPVQRFIDDECIVSETCKVKISELYTCYTDLCHENKEYVLSTIKLSKRLVEKGFEKERNKHGRYWSGIGILDTEHQEEFVEVHDNVFPFNNK